MNTLLITLSGYVEITSQLLTFQNEIVILPSGVPRGCGWGRVITLPNPSHVRYTQNIVGKVSNLVSITPISLWEEREKEVLNCFDDKSEKFSKYSCQSIEIHTWSGHRFSCQIYRCQDGMNRQQEVNKQNLKLKSITAASTKSSWGIKFTFYNLPAPHVLGRGTPLIFSNFCSDIIDTRN